MRHGHQRAHAATDSGRERQQEGGQRQEPRGPEPRLDDDRGNQFDGRSDSYGGRGTHPVAGGGHMEWSTGQDWNAQSAELENRATRGLGWERAGDTMSQPRANVQPQVSHRGKGPKGYKRSDDRIREAVSEALHDDHHVDASDISVVVEDGEVTLTGTVDDRRTKRMAEHLVEGLAGVHDVVNQLRVKRAGETASQGSAMTR